MFGLDVWRETIKKGRLFEFNPQAIRVGLSYDNPDTAERIGQSFRIQGVDGGDPADAAQAANYIEVNFGEPLTISIAKWTCG